MTNITSHLPVSKNNLILLLEPLDDGQKRVKSSASDQIQEAFVVEDVFTMSKTLNNSSVSTTLNPILKTSSAMHVSVPVINKKTLHDKSSSCKKLIQTQKSLKMLDLDSTGTDLDLIPFWNKSTQELSTHLWLPTKTDYVDLDSNSLTGSLKRLMSNSWFSVQQMTIPMCQKNLLKTSFPLQQSLLLKTTDFVHLPSESKDEKKKLPAAKAFKTRIYPTTEQRSTLLKWFGVSRWIYNKCLNEIVNNNCSPTVKELRKRVINNDNFKTENTWMLDYDYDLRDESLQDLIKNYKSNLAKGGTFQIQFKSLKEQSRKNTSISVLSKKWNKERNFYTSVFSPSRMKSHEPLPEKLEYTSRLIRTPLKQYFISIPRPLDIKCENQAPDKRIVSIDPGVRTFLTCYDPSGNVYNIGSRDAGAIARLQHYKRKLQGKIQNPNIRHKQRYKMKLAMLRINTKIQNKVTDFHRRICKWLCENFTHVLIPKLNFHKCKKLSKRQKVLLASLRHCELVDRLINKAREYPWCKIQVVNEAYTSKTCGKC